MAKSTKRSKSRLGSLNLEKAIKKYGATDIITGTWQDTTDTSGSWSVDNRQDIVGYYSKESRWANFANLYVEKDETPGLSSGDLYVGYAQAAVTTVGYGEWNWSKGARVGDYFSGTGSQREDAGRTFISDTSFLG